MRVADDATRMIKVNPPPAPIHIASPPLGRDADLRRTEIEFRVPPPPLPHVPMASQDLEAIHDSMSNASPSASGGDSRSFQIARHKAILKVPPT